MFPDDPTANLNVACAMIESGLYDRAEAYLSKAGNLPEAVHARGVMAARQGREDEARRLFGQAGPGRGEGGDGEPEADGYGVKRMR